MYHSVTFGEKNSWDDWYLIPSTRPVINPPKKKTNFIDIPGSDGHIDLSDVVSGYPVYENRTGTIEFIVENGHKPWSETFSDIMDYLHGKNMKAVLEDDKYYYYEGLFTVDDWKSDKSYSLITIGYNVKPYKREIFSSSEKWRWDNFDFRNGIVRNYSNLSVDGDLYLNVIGSREPNAMVIYATDTDNLAIICGTKSYELKNGRNYIPEIIVKEGENVFFLRGKGNVTVDYRGGRL